MYCITTGPSAECYGADLKGIMEHELELARKSGGLVRSILSRSDL